MAEKISSAKYLTLHGLYVHGGHSYNAKTIADLRHYAQLELQTAELYMHTLSYVMASSRLTLEDRFKAKLEAIGIKVPTVAVGSTPTISQHDLLKGSCVTELHPGNYTMFDAFQCAIGSCKADDIATSVMTRVVLSPS